MYIKKITALITAVCFLTAVTGQSFGQSSAGNAVNTIAAEIAPSVFSERFGKITEFKNYNSPQIIVTIQDLHAHPQTQKNIASILQALDEKYPISNIYTEGASGEVDVTWLFPGKSYYNLDKNIVEQMVNNGTLTGTEYFAFLNGKSNLLGLEDAEIHRRNIARLGSLYENETTNLGIAANVKNEIDYLANKNLSPEMKKYLKISSDYHANKMEAAKYYKVLLDYAGKISGNPGGYGIAFSVDPEEFTEIKKVVLINAISKKLNVKHINAQIQKYLSELKNNMPVSEFNAFLAATDNLNDMDAFLRYISLRGFNGKENAQLESFIKIQELNSQVNPLDLFSQEQKLEEIIRKSLAFSDMEREISFMKDFYAFFEGYITNNLTAKDEQYFNANFETFRNLYGKYAEVNYIDKIKDQFDFLNKYYSANKKRNEIFIEKIDANENLIPGKGYSAQTAENILDGAKEVIVVVTGGFHTYGVNEILDAKNISRITITPRISESVSLSNINYRQIIMDQGRIFREALSFVIASQTSDAQRFKNIIEAGAEYLGKNVSFDDLDELIAEINNIIGSQETAQAIRAGSDNDNAEIRFANGAVLAVSRGADNEITVKTGTSAAAGAAEAEGEIKISDKTVLDAYFGLAKTLAQEAFKSLYSVAVIDINTPAVYSAAKDFFTAQASDGADFGVDGAISPLEKYAEETARKQNIALDEAKASLTIDGIAYNTLARLPEFFQKKALEKQIDKDMSDKGITKGQKDRLQSIKRALKTFALSLMIMLSLATFAACGQNTNQQKEQQQNSAIVQEERADFADVGYIAGAQVENGKIIVEDSQGKFIDYIIKGVCYSRDRDNLTFYENYKKDLPLLEELGVNSIRTYRPFAAYTNGEIDIAKTKEMLDAFQKAGITVSVGFSYADMAEGSLMEIYLKEFGSHPAILTIALGNEYNYHYGDWFSKEEWLERLASAAGRAKNLAPDKIIAVVHGEMPSAQEIKEYKDAGVELIMLNMYRGSGFTNTEGQNAQDQWAVLGTDMPWVLGEFGRSSMAGDGSDTSDAQVEFLQELMARLNEGNGMGYIFSAFDEEWKGISALDNNIGAESALGIYKEDGSEKPATSAIKQIFLAIAEGHDGYYIEDMPSSDEVSEAEQKSFEESPQTGTNAKKISTGAVKVYSGANWRAYALPLGKLDMDEKGELMFEIETLDAQPNSAARIEIRNLGYDGAADASTNIVLPETYSLAENGGKITVTVPFSAIKSLDLNRDVEIVFSTGNEFNGNPLNDEPAGIAITNAVVQEASLELPFFSYILNILGITKQKYPKARAAIIAALEAPFILILSPQAFVNMHGKNTDAVQAARLQGARDMKAKAAKYMRAGAVIGAVSVVLSSSIIGLSVGALFFGIFGISSVLSFTLSVMAMPVWIIPSLAAAGAGAVIAGIVSLFFSHYRWNLANPKVSLDNNVQVNIIYAQAMENLTELQEKYSIYPEVSQDGTVSQSVYVVNKKLSPMAEAKFSNSGIKINGKSVWVMQSDTLGIVYYADGVPFEDIASAVQNKKLENRVKKALKKEKIFLGDRMSADYLNIDAVSNKKGIAYNAQTGSASVYFSDEQAFSHYDSADFGRVRDIRNAEGWQRARSIMIFLDKVKTAADFENYLKILGNASNGNIIITGELAASLMNADKLNPVLEQLRKDGISIMIETGADSRIEQSVINLFDGKFDRTTGNIESAVPGQGKADLNAEMITDAETMESSLAKADKNVVIFESAIEKYVQDDRTGLGKFLEEITSSKILKYFASAEITAESAKETARNFDLEKILGDFPSITSEDVKNMYAALRAGKSAEEIFNVSPGMNVKSGARMYLERIDARVQDETSVSAVKRAYMEGLAEKLAAAVEFKNAGRMFGFKNRNTEKLVGQLASFKYMSLTVSESEASAVRIRMEKMTARNYNNEIISVINENPRAVPVVADLMLEMIFAYESEVRMDKKDFKREPNLQAYEAILKAA